MPYPRVRITDRKKKEVLFGEVKVRYGPRFPVRTRLFEPQLRQVRRFRMIPRFASRTLPVIRTQAPIHPPPSS
jgi:hypothetical protein